MTFKKFDVLLLLQLLLITVCNFLIAWSILQQHLKASVIYFVLILLVQIIILFLFISKHNRSIIQFLNSVKHRDELAKIRTVSVRKSYHEINTLLNDIAESYSKVKIEKESEHQYFLTTLKHVNIGLISFDNKGNIELYNEAAEQLLRIKNPESINDLNRTFKGFSNELKALPPGNAKLKKIKEKGEILHLSLQATQILIKGKKIKLVSIQDIQREIQQEEIESWKKLIQVLTHEIMNSAGPITSLSSTLRETFSDEISSNDRLDELTKKQIITGLTAIEKRSRGLAKFIETYRNLTKIPDPNFTKININDLLRQINALMEEELSASGILFTYKIIPENLILIADEKLLSQILINLIRNSIQAVIPEKEGQININASKEISGQIILHIKDNGKGISEEMLEKVFVPFFSTKKDGSGIGLTLARQIMNMHDGLISIRSVEGQGTEVKLAFN